MLLVAFVPYVMFEVLILSTYVSMFQFIIIYIVLNPLPLIMTVDVS